MAEPKRDAPVEDTPETGAVSGDPAVKVAPKGGAPDVVTTETDPKTTREVQDESAKKGKKLKLQWVVDHSMLGTQNPDTGHHFVRGEIVSEDDLGESFERYKALGAIKPYVKVDDQVAETTAPTEILEK